MAPTTVSPPPPSDAAASSVIDRVTSFVQEHKQAILIGAALTLAAGGAAYYASTGSGGSGGDSSSSGDDAARRKKKKPSQRKRKTGVNEKDGPILEEVQPKNVDDEIAITAGAENRSHEERKALAIELKTKGNKAYVDRKFEDAVKYYTRAIEVSPEEDPVFYSNRAASYMYFPTPEYEKAVEDCTVALRINPKHERSVGRRGNALEKLGRYEEAVRDFMAATILNGFQDAKLSESVDRVLKIVCETEARKILATREPTLPAKTFVDNYFAAFHPPPPPALPENASQGDNTLQLATDAVAARDYTHALSLVNEALEQGISTTTAHGYALNLRGSFRFLVGDSPGAQADLEEAIKLNETDTLSWVKAASVYLEQGDLDTAFKSFDEAIKHNPNDSNIYYHRGQILFIMEKFKEAADNYRKSVELDPEFVFGHIQLAVAQYKDGLIGDSMVSFRRTLKAFPQRSEPYNYYGEVLLEQKRFEDAVEKFEAAIEREQSRPAPINVLPLVNKALAVLQWRNDLAAAEALVQDALEKDPECAPAVATLAQICLQRGETERAQTLFERHVQLVRTEPEIVSSLQFMHASKAQAEFTKNYPEHAEQLQLLRQQQL